MTNPTIVEFQHLSPDVGLRRTCAYYRTSARAMCVRKCVRKGFETVRAEVSAYGQLSKCDLRSHFFTCSPLLTLFYILTYIHAAARALYCRPQFRYISTVQCTMYCLVVVGSSQFNMNPIIAREFTDYGQLASSYPCLSKEEQYFVTKIVLIYCEKKLSYIVIENF